jgi:hypothetical protein
MLTQSKKPLKVSKVSKDISTENADILIREYKHKRWVQNSQTIGKPDSLSSWYSIEEMENFIALAKSNGGDGIKFYYGAYPENYTLLPEYAGRQTLVKIATRSKLKSDGSMVNKDIYVIQNGKTKILSGIIPTNCPPTCNPPSEGGMGDLGITLVDRGENGMEII